MQIILTRNEAETKLKKTFGLEHFYDEQWKAIERILRGERILMIERTGFGKSLCYQFPATVFDGVTVIFSPLIALMRDQVRGLVAKGILAAYINSEQSHEENQEAIRRAKNNEIKILYIAPERQENDEWIEAVRRAVFGANLKMINLNKVNAEKALEHLYEQLKAIAPTMYDFELNVGEPKADGNIEITVLVKANENYKQFTDIVYNTLTSLSSNNVSQLEAMNIKYTTAAIDKRESSSLSKRVIAETASLQERLTSPITSKGVIVGTASGLKQKRKINVLYDLNKAVETINKIQKHALFGFTVTDNLQKVYPFDLPRVKSSIDYEPHKTHSSQDLGSFDLFMTPEYGLNEYGNRSDKIMLWAIRLEKKPFSFESKYWTIGDYLLFIPEAAPGTICMNYRNNFAVPVEYLMQLTGFTVEHKDAL